MGSASPRGKISFALFGTKVSFKLPRVRRMFGRKKDPEPEW